MPTLLNKYRVLASVRHIVIIYWGYCETFVCFQLPRVSVLFYEINLFCTHNMDYVYFLRPILWIYLLNSTYKVKFHFGLNFNSAYLTYIYFYTLLTNSRSISLSKLYRTLIATTLKTILKLQIPLYYKKKKKKISFGLLLWLFFLIIKMVVKYSLISK